MSDELSGLRHKLRNSLNNISMNAELVKLLSESSNSPAEVSSAIDRILSECRETAEYMDTLSNDNKSRGDF